jgi:hypothetical protein
MKPRSRSPSMKPRSRSPSMKPRSRPLKFDLPPYEGKNADNDLKLLANENNYKVVQVEKDGNCLFRAVSKSASLNLNIQYTHTELRKMVVYFLKNNKNFLEPYIDYILRNDNDQSYIEKVDKYIQNMARPGVWGDFICLLVLSEVLKVMFKVLILNTQTFQLVSNKDVYTLEIPIGFIDEYHYTALIPTRNQMPILTPSVVPPPSVVPSRSVVPSSSVAPSSSIAPKIPPPIFDKTIKPLSSVNELLEIMDKVKPYIYDDISQLNKAERQIMVSLGM